MSFLYMLHIVITLTMFLLCDLQSDELVFCKIHRSDHWKRNENDETNASIAECTKDTTNTTAGDRPNWTKDTTNETLSDRPSRNKRQKKSSDPTPPSNLIQQHLQQCAPQIPSHNPQINYCWSNLEHQIRLPSPGSAQFQ